MDVKRKWAEASVAWPQSLTWSGGAKALVKIENKNEWMCNGEVDRVPRRRG
jgi:hypothetical protein